MNLTRLIRGARHPGAGAAFTASAAPGTTQPGFLIDASGSIGTSNFTTARRALGAPPTDGSIEVTIYLFPPARSRCWRRRW